MGIHDQLFKQLLSKYFVEFLNLFLPDLASYLFSFTLEDGDKELLDVFQHRDSRQVDVVKKVKGPKGELQAIVHVEAQSQRHTGFAPRMLRYYVRLLQKYSVPVYPIALFAFDKPLKKQPNQYQVSFANVRFLEFYFHSVQLNRLDWRKFKNQLNPVAVALLPKMKIAKTERYLVKLNCDLIMASLDLDEEGLLLLSKFVEVYLPLSETERQKYIEEFKMLSKAEQDNVIELLPTWWIEALKQGRNEGKRQLIVALIEKRFGQANERILEQVDKLADQQLEELGILLLNLNSSDELLHWLTSNV